MFMIDYKQVIWWYWLVLAWLLTAGVSGYEAGFVLAIGVSVMNLLHSVISERRMTAFPVQVRFWFLIYVVVALPEPMQILYWLPAVGTWARSIFGYCILDVPVDNIPTIIRHLIAAAETDMVGRNARVAGRKQRRDLRSVEIAPRRLAMQQE